MRLELRVVDGSNQLTEAGIDQILVSYLHVEAVVVDTFKDNLFLFLTTRAFFSSEKYNYSGACYINLQQLNTNCSKKI